MAIGVSPQRLREVRFAEQWRGYRTDEVDEFVERVAEAFDELERRLRETADRAARAEQALAERGPADPVSRTLVLAQRTADAALHEAEAEAARLVADAEERASSLVDESEGRAARQRADMEARAASEVHDLVELRRALESDVMLLRVYVREQRVALVEELRENLRWLESGEHLATPPVSGPWSSSRPPVSDEARRPALPHVPSPPATGEDVPSVDELEALASRAEELRLGIHSRRPVPLTPMGETADAGSTAEPGEDGGAGAHSDAEAGGIGGSAVEGRVVEGKIGEGAARDAVQAPLPEAEVEVEAQVEAEAEEIPWRRPSGDARATGSTPDPSSSAPAHEDPFIAELRRAVDDPEPLGPRDDDGLWVDDAGTAPQETTTPARFLRRRGR